jgi:hypothetical protein
MDGGSCLDLVTTPPQPVFRISLLQIPSFPTPNALESITHYLLQCIFEQHDFVSCLLTLHLAYISMPPSQLSVAGLVRLHRCAALWPSHFGDDS